MKIVLWQSVSTSPRDATRSSTFSLPNLLKPVSLTRSTVLLLWFNHFLETSEVNHKILGPVFSRLHKDHKWLSYKARTQVRSVFSFAILSPYLLFHRSPRGPKRLLKTCHQICKPGSKKKEKGKGKRVLFSEPLIKS